MPAPAAAAMPVAMPTMPSAAAPSYSLQAFLESNGLGQFFAAFEMFGVGGLEDLAEGSLFDDATCRDIGKSIVSSRLVRGMQHIFFSFEFLRP